MAAASFSFAAGLLGFAIDVSKDLAFSTSLPATVQTFWGTLRGVAFALAVVLFLIGGALSLRGHNRLQKIKEETDHGPD